MMKRDKVRLALVGAGGMLAAAVRRLAPPQYEIFPFDLPGFDLTDREGVLEQLAAVAPQVIVNCAAYTDVDGCESLEVLATRVNGEGPGSLAAAACELGATLVHISTDYVFAGDKGSPYTEEDPVGPASAYGRSKLHGERAVLESGLQRYFIVRTSWLYGPGGKNFVETMVRLARELQQLRVVADQVGSPTYTGDLANAIFRLLEVGEPGLYHFADTGSCSWHVFAEAIVDEARRSGEPVVAETVQPIATVDYPLPAPRPAYSVLSTEKYRTLVGVTPPDWRESLREYFALRRQ